MSGPVVHTVSSPETDAKVGNDARVIVGISQPEGSELWVPTGGRGPAYDDYDPGDTSERQLPLDDTHAERLASFFERCLLPNVHRTRMVPGKWDCHSFALWMVGEITDPESIDLSRTEAIEYARMRTARKIEPHKLKLGELGLVGGRNEHGVVADHSVIGLGRGRSLQVLGTHGLLIIANNERTVRHYQEHTIGKFSGREYGMHAVRRGFSR